MNRLKYVNQNIIGLLQIWERSLEKVFSVYKATARLKRGSCGHKSQFLNQNGLTGFTVHGLVVTE